MANDKDKVNEKQHADKARALDEHTPRETDHPYAPNEFVHNTTGSAERIRRQNSINRDRRTWKYSKLDGEKVNIQSEEQD
jgi:hypothetical protein